MALATWVLLTVVIYCIVPSIPLCSFKNLVPVLFSLSTNHSSYISWFQCTYRRFFQCLGLSLSSLAKLKSSSIIFFGIFYLSYNFDHNHELAITNNSDSSVTSNTPLSNAHPSFHLNNSISNDSLTPMGNFCPLIPPPFRIAHFSQVLSP